MTASAPATVSRRERFIHTEALAHLTYHLYRKHYPRGGIALLRKHDMSKYPEGSPYTWTAVIIHASAEEKYADRVQVTRYDFHGPSGHEIETDELTAFIQAYHEGYRQPAPGFLDRAALDFDRI